MSEGGFDAEFVLSLAITVVGGAISAYLAKKVIDELDTGKKVYNRIERMRNRMQMLQRNHMLIGNESLKLVQESL